MQLHLIEISLIQDVSPFKRLPKCLNTVLYFKSILIHKALAVQSSLDRIN